LACFALLSPVLLFAQADQRIGLKCSTWTVFDDNAFKNYQMAPDVVTQPNAVLFYSRETEQGGFRMEYEGALALFRDYPSRRFQHHVIGLGGSRVLNDSGTVSFYWGLDAARRWNESDYAYYNYGAYSAFMNMRYSGWEGGSMGAGFSGELRDFKELPQFNFIEGRTYIQPTVSLQTRTTLIGQFQLGYKKFTESVVSEEAVQRTVRVVVRNTGNGRGQGQNGFKVVPITVTRTVQSASPGKSVLQFTGLLRAAQSVFSGTGLAVQGLIRRNPKQDGRFLTFQDGGYEDEDVLFDDPYGYESDEWSLEWTQLLPWKFTLKAGWDWKDKRYSHSAYDVDGNPITDTLRRDRRANLWLTLKRTIRIKGFSPYPSVVLSYLSAKNRSNDAYYDYINHVWSVGVSFGF
jgi:hypothetical protein